MPTWARAILRVVNFILGSSVYGVASSWVAVLACSFARPNSLLSSLVETQRILILFPFLCSLLIDLYIWHTYSWPNCYRGLLSTWAAALLLVSSVILYCFSTGSVLNVCAIAGRPLCTTNSAFQKQSLSGQPYLAVSSQKA